MKAFIGVLLASQPKALVYRKKITWAMEGINVPPSICFALMNGQNSVTNGETMKQIFVFGSNLAGRHGKGAALDAYKRHGAVYGQAIGYQGCAYGIPTKDRGLNTLSLSTIRSYVLDFLIFANEHSEMQFNVTRIGCGLAGKTDKEIAPMFIGAPDNVILPDGWRELVGRRQPVQE